MAEFVQAYTSGETTKNERKVQKKSLFLFITATKGIPGCFVQAIESEFPEVAVRQVTDFKAACSHHDLPVALVFIDLRLFHQLPSWAPSLSRAHPGAMVALLQTDHRSSVPIKDILRLDGVCGVLPMHMKLDVWLSVIRLLLIGGDYIPAAMLRALVTDNGDAGHRHPASTSSSNFDPRDLEGLTEREMQILELVARGLQNKVIAAALQLSEHTVKIHLHNIITKLGTSNRTEAAAIFHRSRGPEHDGVHQDLAHLSGR